MSANKQDNFPLKFIRIDKWLWAARFYKTRSLAAKAINTGKIKLNGQNVKVSSQIKVADLLLIRRGPYLREYEVLALNEIRGPAKVAQTLYRETQESIERSAQLKQNLSGQPRIERSPNKPGKRAIRSGRILKRGQ